MKEETIKNIESYLKAHELLTLATVSAEGKPMAHSVEYIHEGNTVYFITHFGTRKIENIKNNPNVAYTVDEVCADWMAIQGIQMMGKASIIEEQEEIGRIMGVYAQKFPQIANFPPEFSEGMKLVKIDPLHAKYIDNTKGMGYSETVEY